MRQTSFLVMSAVLLSTLSISRGDETKAPFKPGKADVRGQVSSVTAAPGGKDILGRILVEGKKEADTTHDKASVSVTKATKIERVVKGELKPAQFTDLKKGMKVQADFTGPVAESYPVQARAKSILILE
jgi:beta-N-acetylhexosaminidase